MSYLFPNYAKWEIQPASAQGSYLEDTSGKTYLDFTSGIGVCGLGHRPESVQTAIQEQLDSFWHTSNLFDIPLHEVAASQLVESTNLSAVFFANSGAEANEAAFKIARKSTGKSKIISCDNSFHGRTFATMAATGQDKVKEGFGRLDQDFIHIPFNDLDTFKKTIDDQTAAVIVELIQGEGGVVPGNVEFLEEIQHLCVHYGALMMIDEIQTGIGRTGKKYGYQNYGLDPDVITVAKGIANGLPLGAMIGKSYLADSFGPGSHGSTFGGNPVAVAASVAVMNEIFDKEFLKHVDSRGKYLIQELKQEIGSNAHVIDIRGTGLMIGIELDIDAVHILEGLRQSGLLALPAGPTVIRLLPPLTVSKEEIKLAIVLIKEAFRYKSGRA